MTSLWILDILPHKCGGSSAVLRSLFFIYFPFLAVRSCIPWFTSIMNPLVVWTIYYFGSSALLPVLGLGCNFGEVKSW